MKQFAKPIRILEVPLLLLVIALAFLEIGNFGVSVFLIIVSVGRLIINSITDKVTYKK